jgi:hypothetical protein
MGISAATLAGLAIIMLSISKTFIVLMIWSGQPSGRGSHLASGLQDVAYFVRKVIQVLHGLKIESPISYQRPRQILFFEKLLKILMQF